MPAAISVSLIPPLTGCWRCSCTTASSSRTRSPGPTGRADAAGDRPRRRREVSDVRTKARPLLVELAEQFNETVHLMTLEGTQVRYFDCGRGHPRLSGRLRAPATCCPRTALGRQSAAGRPARRTDSGRCTPIRRPSWCRQIIRCTSLPFAARGTRRGAGGRLRHQLRRERGGRRIGGGRAARRRWHGGGGGRRGGANHAVQQENRGDRLGVASAGQGPAVVAPARCLLSRKYPASPLTLRLAVTRYIHHICSVITDTMSDLRDRARIGAMECDDSTSSPGVVTAAVGAGCVLGRQDLVDVRRARRARPRVLPKDPGRTACHPRAGAGRIMHCGAPGRLTTEHGEQAPTRGGMRAGGRADRVRCHRASGGRDRLRARDGPAGARGPVRDRAAPRFRSLVAAVLIPVCDVSCCSPTSFAIPLPAGPLLAA